MSGEHDRRIFYSHRLQPRLPPSVLAGRSYRDHEAKFSIPATSSATFDRKCTVECGQGVESARPALGEHRSPNGCDAGSASEMVILRHRTPGETTVCRPVHLAGLRLRYGAALAYVCVSPCRAHPTVSQIGQVVVVSGADRCGCVALVGRRFGDSGCGQMGTQMMLVRMVERDGGCVLWFLRGEHQFEIGGAQAELPQV